MTIVVQSAGSQWQAGNTYIGYDNILQRNDAVVVASAQTPGWEVENATTWNGAQQWRGGGSVQSVTISFPAPVECNSWGVYRHTYGFAQSGSQTVRGQYSSDGVVWNDLGVPVTPGNNDNRTLFQIHSSTVNVRYYRLLVDPAEITNQVSHIFFGKSVKLYGSPDTGFTPPSVAFEDKVINNISESGNFVGRSLIRKAMRTSFNISVVDANWVLNDWRDLLEVVQEHPFYFAWDSANYPTDVAYCWTDRPVGKPTFTSPRHMQINLSFHAIQDQLIEL